MGHSHQLPHPVVRVFSVVRKLCRTRCKTCTDGYRTLNRNRGIAGRWKIVSSQQTQVASDTKCQSPRLIANN